MTLFTCQNPLIPTKTVAFGNTFSESDWPSAVPGLVTHIKGPFQDQQISRKETL